MAERFYSHYPEDSSFLKYATCVQSTAVIPATTSSDLEHSASYFAQAIDNTNINNNSNYNRLSSLRYFGAQSFNTNIKSSNTAITKYSGQQNIQSNYLPATMGASTMPMGIFGQQQMCQSQMNGQYTHGGSTCFNRNRYMPYNCSNRMYASSPTLGLQYHQHFAPVNQNGSSNSGSTVLQPIYERKANDFYNITNSSTVITSCNGSNVSSNGNIVSTPNTYGSRDSNQTVTLQINNLDYSMDEPSLRNFLSNQLKPITPVVSLVFEGSSYAKVTVPDLHFAKQVVANLHRKKIGQKRMVVSYTRDSSLTEINTLRCQVAGLLKDVPYCTLPMYKFRELFQSRFKISISVLDLYKMQDICSITADKNEEKYISLHPDLINSLESNSPLMEGLQHSVPYCTTHFKREQDKGWAEQDIEPLPNVFMKISEIQQIIYPLLKSHHGDIPVASLIHCIAGELNIQIVRNESGVNLEHLICCVHGIQITTNNFGIKILSWLEPENAIAKDNSDGRLYSKNGTVCDPLYQISREVVELVKISPKSTMKFNRFIPAYHNHFGKQCRVADYGYTKLIELFEALVPVIQIMGDGENRQITLTHRTQIRRFTSDLLRVLRSQGNKSILLSQLPKIFSQAQNRIFDITDYGVCDIVDILDGLVNSNVVVVTTVQNGNDILISIPKRKQTNAEIEKTCVFAGEVVELFRNAPQYTILFQKFVRSYHYHFGYQCRLSEYGFLKLADLMEAIQGVVEIEFTSDEDKKIFLSPKVAQRVFAEQIEDLIKEYIGCARTCMKLDEVLNLHKKKFGYQIQPQTLGFTKILDAIQILPYIELLKTNEIIWIICHYSDPVFRTQGYRASKIIQEFEKDVVPMNEFINVYALKHKETLSENTIIAMKHAIEVKTENGIKFVKVTRLIQFLTSIVKLLEQKSFMTLSEIKNALHFEIGTCFEFGYPNLFTLLRAYSDIFIVNVGSTQERSEIGLHAKGELVSHVSRNYPWSQQTGELEVKEKNPSPNERQPLASCNRIAKPRQRCVDPIMCNLQNCPKNCYPEQIKPIDVVACNEMTTMMNHSVCNKENSFNTTIFNGSFNSSLESEQNTSAGSISTGSGSSGEATKLWDRRFNSSKQFNDFNQNGMFELVNFVPYCSYYEPPKPDTPPSDSMPFWIDPIWANSIDETTPQIDSLNIHLPELKSFNILPMLVSPYTLSKTENMKNIFAFENPDKKIS